MEIVIRGLIVYMALLVLMRLAGSRQFSEVAAFDAVLVILIAEVTGQALVGEDYSLTAAFVVLTTIVGTDIALSLAKHRWSTLRTAIDGVPVLLVNDGKLVRRAMDKGRVEGQEILSAARGAHGVESLSGIKYAVLEANGSITVVPAS